jgi:hypothetical protein
MDFSVNIFMDKSWKILVLYFIYFTFLFLQFPINNSLPGNVDTWLYVAIFNDYINLLKSGFSVADYGTSLYPIKQAFLFGEPSFLPGAIFAICKTILSDNLWAYYFSLTIAYTWNAIGVNLIAREIYKNKYVAFFCGLAFASSAFILGNKENQNAIFYGPGLLAIHCQIKYYNSTNIKYLLWCSFWLAAQVYSSSYIFLFISVIAGTIWFKIILNKKSRGELNETIRSLFQFSALALVLISPFLYLYVYHPPIDSGYNPINLLNYTPTLSLNFKDFFRPLNNNLLYQAPNDMQIDWIRNFHCAFPGVLIITLAMSGAMFNSWGRWFLVTYLLGIIVSWGPYIAVGDMVYKAPLYPLYKYCHFNNFLRLPVRAYGICALALALIAGAGLKNLMSNLKRYSSIVFIICLFFMLIEQVPHHFRHFNSSKYLVIPKQLVSINMAEKQQNILFLPSRLYDTERYFKSEIGETAREHIYMFWKTSGNHNVLNGSNGYVPLARVSDNQLINDIENPVSFKKLMISRKVNFIICAKKMLLQGETFPKLDRYISDGSLSLVSADDECTIYKVNSRIIVAD